MFWRVVIFLRMVKHFENLWEEVEKFAIQASPKKTTSDIVDELKTKVFGLTTNVEGADLGVILFHLCELSIRLNVNTYAALQKELQDRKIDDLDL